MTSNMADATCVRCAENTVPPERMTCDPCMDEIYRDAPHRDPRKPQLPSDDVVLGLQQVRYILKSVMNGDDQRAVAPKAIEVIDAAITALQVTEGDKLQPVETAPKDGSYFLFVGSNFDGGAAVVHWDTDFDWWQLDDGKNPEIALRHESKLIGWLPLPAAVTAALHSKQEGD